MNIKLSKPFASNSAVDEFDVKQLKKILNRLGYYMPMENTGITGIPDRAVFNALKAFQNDQGLAPTGAVKPDDETVRKLNSASARRKGKYVWRTMEDERVRDSHAEMNRTVRDFEDDPDPGEEPNCRCWAAPVNCDEEFITQNVISDVNDAKEQWTWIDYWNHFKDANGEPVTLSGIGYLGDVIDVAREKVFPRVSEQVAGLAREQGPGPLYYTTNNDYSFESASYPLGDAVVASETIGTVSASGRCLIIDATVTYNFSDVFTDPAELRDKILRNWPSGKLIIGTSDPDHPLFDEYKWTEFGGTYYSITDTWQNKLSGIIKRKP